MTLLFRGELQVWLSPLCYSSSCHLVASAPCILVLAVSGSLSGFAGLGTATPEKQAYSPFCHLCCRTLNRTGDTRCRMLSALVELCCLSENAEPPAKPGPREALKDPADVTKQQSVWSCSCLQEVPTVSLWVQPRGDSTSTLDFLIKWGESSWILKSSTVCCFRQGGARGGEVTITIFIISAGRRPALYHSRHVLHLLDECRKLNSCSGTRLAFIVLGKAELVMMP